uniref:Uncharacterized protein n=1 Tax=Glossina brevipalpis TaxID=37001 RepID=A0A1A9X2S1_9MUSC
MSIYGLENSKIFLYEVQNHSTEKSLRHCRVSPLVAWCFYKQQVFPRAHSNLFPSAILNASCKYLRCVPVETSLGVCGTTSSWHIITIRSTICVCLMFSLAYGLVLMTGI